MTPLNIQSSRERIVILIAAIGIIAGGVAFFVGEWSVGIGIAGVVNKLISDCGMGLIGVGALAIGIVFAKSLVAGFASETPADRRRSFKQLVGQLATALLNLLVYGGIFVLVLGGIAALDGASAGTIAVVIVIWVLCIVGFVAYRRFRKRLKTSYGIVGYLGMVAFLVVLGAVMLVGFGLTATGAVQDLVSGPRTVEAFLVDAGVDHPSWRYRFAVQTDHVLTFYTPDEERIVLEVPDNDIESAQVINDLGNFVQLTYYPHTQVFCDATLWENGVSEMGPELLDKLHETYDFVL